MEKVRAFRPGLQCRRPRWLGIYIRIRPPPFDALAAQESAAFVNAYSPGDVFRRFLYGEMIDADGTFRA